MTISPTHRKQLAKAGTVLKPLVLALATIGAVHATPPAPTQLPTGGQVVAGSAVVTTSGSAMSITQSSQRAAIDWNTFNLGSAASIQFNQQQGAASVTLNRVLDSNPSQIFGHITAPGQVFFSNPNGIYFAPGASVDVGGMVATTHGISNADFMAGRYHFDRKGATGSVINDGELKGSLGGYIALLAPEVRNRGVILAQLGTVALAAGESYDLTIAGSNTLASVIVEPSTLQALVDNAQAIQAEGGLIILSARAANQLQGGVVRNSGSLIASSLVEKGGRILLSADDITLTASSRIDASGATGGGQVLVGGDWQGSGSLYQASTVTMDSGARIDASATQNGDGGKVVLWSALSNPDALTSVHGEILVRGGLYGGNGGRVETSGHQVDVNGARVNAGAPSGVAGSWLLDPVDITVAASGGNITGSTIAIALQSTNVTLDTSGSGSCSGATCSALGGTNGDILVNDNILAAGGTPGMSLTLKADRHIFVDTNKTIRTNNGDIVLWADANNDGQGKIALGANATLNSANGASNQATGGGRIVLGGGSDPTIGYATTVDNQNAMMPNGSDRAGGGITFNTGVSLISGGGNISIRGKSTTSDGYGLMSMPGLTINSGNGNIDITAYSTNYTGVEFNAYGSGGDGATSIRSGAATGDAIRMTLSGMAGGLYDFNHTAANPTNIIADGGGNINLIGNLLPGATPDRWAILLDADNILATTGSISINGGTQRVGFYLNDGAVALGALAGSTVTSSSSNISVTAGQFVDMDLAPAKPRVSTSGSLSLWTTLSNFSTSWLSFAGSNLSGLNIGSAGNTGVLAVDSALSLNGPIVFNADQLTGSSNINFGTGSFILTQANTSTFGGVISGSGSFTKAGSGALTLSGANTYTGATNITGGLLNVSGSLSDTSALTIASGASYGLLASDMIGSVAGSGAINLGSSTLTVGDSSSTTFSGAVSGAGGITKLGSGVLTMSGSNTYTGNTIVSGGTLEIGGASTLNGNSNTTVASGATLNWTSSANQTFNGNTSNGIVPSNYALLGGGTVNLAGTGSVFFSGTQGFTGVLNVAQSVLVNGATSGGGSSLKLGLGSATAINVNNGGVLTAGVIGTTNDNSFVGASGTAADHASIIINQGGTLLGVGDSKTLYNFVLNGGTLAIGSVSANGQQWGSFAFHDGIAVTADSAITGNLGQIGTINVNVSAGKTLTFSGALNDAGGGAAQLTKAGGGTLLLSGSNSYSGVTTINAGILKATNSNALGVSAGGTTVASGATLWLDGVSVTDNISLAGTGVASGGAMVVSNTAGSSGTLTIADNASIRGTGSLNLGAITLAAGKSLALGGGEMMNITTGAIAAADTNTALTVSTLGTLNLGVVGTTGNRIGTVSIDGGASTLNGIFSTSTIVARSSGNLTVAGNVSTTDTTSSAIILNAGKNAAAGTPGGGNLIISGGAVSTGTGGRASLYSGALADTSLATLVGSGSGHFRYNSDESTSNFTAALGSGLFAIYREQPVLSLTPASTVITYGASLPVIGVTYSGYVNGDLTTDVISGTAGWTVGGVPSPAGHYLAGTHDLIYTTGLSSSLGYALVKNAGSSNELTVNKAALSVLANGVGKTYDGVAYSGGNGVVYTGFVAGESNSVLNGTLTYAGSSQGAINAGNYAITPQGLSAANYQIAYVDGTLAVAKAPLSVAANEASKTYDGVAYSGGNGIAYSGFVAGENSSALSGTLAYVGSSQGAVNAGNYAITPQGLTAANYQIRFVDGTLAISPATPAPQTPPATPAAASTTIDPNSGQSVASSSLQQSMLAETTSSVAAPATDNNSVAGVGTDASSTDSKASESKGAAGSKPAATKKSAVLSGEMVQPPAVKGFKRAYIVLLENADGTTGKIIVKGEKGEQVVESAGFGVPLDGSVLPQKVSSDLMKQDFSNAREARPTPGER